MTLYAPNSYCIKSTDDASANWVQLTCKVSTPMTKSWRTRNSTRIKAPLTSLIIIPSSNKPVAILDLLLTLIMQFPLLFIVSMRAPKAVLSPWIYFQYCLRFWQNFRLRHRLCWRKLETQRFQWQQLAFQLHIVPIPNALELLAYKRCNSKKMKL